MRLARTARRKGEGGIAFLVIILLILGGIAWWLYSTRQNAEKGIRTFAAEFTKRTVVNHDGRYLNLYLSPGAQAQYLPSWRDRLIERLREFGVPAEPIQIDGDVSFTSQFFDPHGLFRAQLKYPTTSAQLELGISRGMTMWQVDTVDLTWTPPPVPTPTPGVGPEASPTPTPTPTPEPKVKRKRRN